MLDSLYTYMKDNLPPKRYSHTLGVIESAIKLAKIYDVDEKRAELAALLHDISKYMDIKTMHEYIESDDDTLKYYGHIGELLHGFAGSSFVKKNFKIYDEDVLNAIKYHTVGRRNMTKLEKIIYLADAIEPRRNYPMVEEIRKKALISIDEAILFEVGNKLRHLLDINATIHPNTIHMRNSILKDVKV